MTTISLAFSIMTGATCLMAYMRNPGRQEKSWFMVSWVPYRNGDLFRDSSRRLLLQLRTVLRVAGSGMKSHCASAPIPPEQLKPVRSGKIERMNMRRHGVEQKATPIDREQAKGAKKEIPRACFQNAECGRPRPQQQPFDRGFPVISSGKAMRTMLRPGTGAPRQSILLILKTRPGLGLLRSLL
jgi:hypothetical protein